MIVHISWLIIFLNKISLSNAFHLGISDSFTNQCKIPNLKPWIYFPYGVCLHLIVDVNQYPLACITTLTDTLTASGVVIYQKSLTHMQNRNISKCLKTNCESYLFVMEKPQDWFQEIDRHQQMNKTRRIFYPFARFYFLSLYGTDIGPFCSIATYFYRNAFFGYKFNFDGIGEVSSIQDVVKNSTIKISPNFTDLSHPFVDTNNQQHRFTVGVFNCPPHIIFLDKNGSR